MYSADVRRRAVALMERGNSLRSISLSTGISRATLRDWREHPEIKVNPRAVCARCAASPTLPEPQTDYAYLFGLYLGDGCISLAGARDASPTAISGTSIRDICSRTSPET